MMQLSEELTSTENRVSFARQAFNDQVMAYNTYKQSFPPMFFAPSFWACARCDLAGICRQRSHPSRAESIVLTSVYNLTFEMNFFESQDRVRKNTLHLVFLFSLAVVTLVIMTNLLVMMVFGYINSEQMKDVGALFGKWIGGYLPLSAQVSVSWYWRAVFTRSWPCRLVVRPLRRGWVEY